MRIFMGLDLGQGRQPSGLCVAELQKRDEAGTTRAHFVVRHLERFASGARFTDVSKRAAEVVDGIRRRVGRSPDIYIDVTGMGQSVCDLFDEVVDARIVPVYFTHGDRRSENRDGLRLEVQLGKAFLVGRLQVLLQTGRLHLTRTAEADTLAQELRDYEVKLVPDANERAGAFRVGTYDELVTALGLAVQVEPPGPGIYIA